MSLLERLARFWYRKFADRSQAFTENLSFAKVLQQIRVRAYTKSHWQKMETKNLTIRTDWPKLSWPPKNCATLIARLNENSATEWSWPKLRKLLSRGYKSGSGSDVDHNYNIGSAVSQILVFTSVQDSDIDFSISDLTSAEIFKTAAPQILILALTMTAIWIDVIFADVWLLWFGVDQLLIVTLLLLAWSYLELFGVTDSYFKIGFDLGLTLEVKSAGMSMGMKWSWNGLGMELEKTWKRLWLLIKRSWPGL